MESGKCIAGCGIEHLDLGAAADGYTDALKAVMRSLYDLPARDELHEVMLTLPSQVHVLRPVRAKECAGLFLFLAVDKENFNEALIRFKFAQIEQTLSLS